MDELDPPTILVVDGDRAVTDAFARVLRREGYAVEEAHDTEAGLEAAMESVPDAVILELGLVHGRGRDFLDRLRGCRGLEAVPVAIVSGDYFVEEQTITQLRSRGVEVRFKPLCLDDLLCLAHRLTTTTGKSGAETTP